MGKKWLKKLLYKMRVPSFVPYYKVLPSWLPFRFCLDESIIPNDLFLFVLANLSSSFLVTTELDLDRDETVVFRDAKKPETFVTVQHYTLGITQIF